MFNKRTCKGSREIETEHFSSADAYHDICHSAKFIKHIRYISASPEALLYLYSHAYDVSKIVHSFTI